MTQALNRLMFFCLIGVLASGKTALAAEKPLNVLFIAVDDLRPELGCYGANYSQSPYLDAFAKSALQFNRHYVQVATCGASRYALLTGRSPASSGVTRSNAAAYQGKTAFETEQLPGAQTMPELFRRSGYETICIGKISHTPDGRVYAYDGSGDGRDELPHAWDLLPTPFGEWKRGWGIFFAYENGIHREDGMGHQDLMEFQAEQDNELPDGMLAETAMEHLKRLHKEGKSFYMGLGFFKPHLPFVATRKDWEAFSTTQIPVSADAKPEHPYWHKSGEFYKYDAPYEKTRPLSTDAKKIAKRAYAACVRYVDRQIGKVLHELEESGLAQSTVVVVWGDHGWHLGEQQIWGKHSPFEQANRSVLMIRAPNMNTAGQQSDALVETIDLYPTLIELCKPEFQRTVYPLDGSSLAPLLRGEQDTVDDVAISYWGDAVSLRTNEFRLIARKLKKQSGYQAISLQRIDSHMRQSADVLAEHKDLADRLMQQHLTKLNQ